MASQINISNIDATFPVAGQDNSSQGFRDNFANIKIALSTATTEISDLQLNTVKLNEENDFAFAGTVKRLEMNRVGFTADNSAPTNGTIDFSLAQYHLSAITTNTTFVVTNWPASGIYAKVRLEIKPTTATPAKTIAFSAGGGTVVKSSGAPTSVSSLNPTIWDIWTTDGGTRVFVQYVGVFS